MERRAARSHGRAAPGWLSPALWIIGAFLVIQSLPTSTAVKRHDFKTCDQSGFCKRNRALADRAGQAGTSWQSPYELQAPEFSRGSFRAAVSNALFPQIKFSLEVRFQHDGTARVLMDEVDGLRQRYNEAAKWTLGGEPAVEENDGRYETDVKETFATIKYHGGHNEARIDYKPLTITFFRHGQPHIVLNERKLFNMEHFRVKTVGNQPEELVVEDPEHPDEQLVVVQNEAFPGFLPPTEDGMWEETFNGKTDSKPKGPESLSLDITFPGYEHVYGIPEHASTLNLKETRGGEGAYTDPYRLYNLDVFEYEADSEMALYGSIPFMQAQRAGSSVAVLFVTGSELWVDVTRSPTAKTVTSAFKKAKKVKEGSEDGGPSGRTTSTHWMAESGILDLFVFLGPTPADVFDAYTTLTGRTPLPQLFALGYQQSRWQYWDERSVLEVQSKFDEADIPLESITLDVDFTPDKRYFLWERHNFPTPEKMQEKLAERGRKLITIVDPHIKRDPDYYIYKEAQELDILVKQPDGKSEFEGWCWPGSSSWTDWFNPKSHDWWIKQFRFDKYKGSTPNLFIWNDMNEPSIFNGPEITMQKDAIHHGGWEHRDVHNIVGMIYHNLSMQGVIEREDPPRRPFVLTRAYFAGSQRYGAMWTGDNMGDWPHLASTVPMLLSNNIAGMPFTGSDVGGFFGNPPPEMMTRWHQVGAFSPFFRAHGHIDTKRREVYLFDQPYQGIMRDAIRLRYSLLPVFYTAFYETSKTGIPIMRPQYVVFPQDPKGFALDDQFYLGSSGLLIKPVVEEGVTSQDVYISDDQPYYHYLTHEVYFGASHGGTHIKVPAPLESIPILQRGGHILARRDIVRRAAVLSWRDPITLIIATDLAGTSASGSLYLDDGDSFDHEKGDYVHRSFALAPESKGSKTLKLQNRAAEAYDESNAYAQKISDVPVRRIVVLGLPTKPLCVKVVDGAVGLEFEWKDGVAATGSRRSSGKPASVLVVKDANSPIVKDWDLVFEFDSSKTCAVTSAVDYEAALQSPECPVGRFRCRNEGHIPGCILLSRVNDGVCDEECCDGSDETDGKALCPNRCAAVNAEYRKQKAEADRKQRVGASVRNDYIKFGVREKAKLEAELEKAQNEIADLQQREQSAKTALEILEQAEAGEIERKKNSQLYQRIVEMQTVIKALRLHRQNLEGHISDLSGILSDLSRDFNPNFQDMAVLGATRAFRDWKVANGMAVEDGEGSESGQQGETAAPPAEKPTEEELVADDYTDEELKKLEEEDPLSLIDSVNLRVGAPVTSGVASIFRLDDYVPDKWRPLYDGYKRQLVDFLIRTGVVYAPVSQGSDRPELLRARTAHTDLVDELHHAEVRLEDAKKQLEKDWGRDWEWRKLDGTCIEKDAGEYTYSLCFFGEATQKSNNNGARTSLGAFKGWSSDAVQGSDEYYMKQLYVDGQRCWNGPARSAKVDLVCGTSNALISVVEPEKCEYVFQVTTPAVCYPPTAEAEEGAKGAKDEL
ncbi:alpha 1,3-glucosidase, glycoside hydrolase family 31 protein [Rhodotorula toruloides]|uniref:Glucosidase 2 subunit beta n=1 Tax=Rhodotorula toruloides TaxID=5286 RepID=A0A511KHI9_RHOTO|nr:alpha 1,3-glucosidase, glycoside hydrolase family 31 protein [Rhodotorula toruloides]